MYSTRVDIMLTRVLFVLYCGNMGVDYRPNAGHGFHVELTEEGKKHDDIVYDLCKDGYVVIQDGSECYTGVDNDLYFVFENRDMVITEDDIYKLREYIKNSPYINIINDTFQHWITLQVW